MTETHERAQEIYDAVYAELYMLTFTRHDAAKHMAKIAIEQIIRSWEEDGSPQDVGIIEWWQDALKDLEKIEK